MAKWENLACTTVQSNEGWAPNTSPWMTLTLPMGNAGAPPIGPLLSKEASMPDAVDQWENPNQNPGECGPYRLSSGSQVRCPFQLMIWDTTSDNTLTPLPRRWMGIPRNDDDPGNEVTNASASAPEDEEHGILLELPSTKQQCPICPTVYNTVRMLRDHLAETHGARGAICRCLKWRGTFETVHQLECPKKHDARLERDPPRREPTPSHAQHALNDSRASRACHTMKDTGIPSWRTHAAQTPASERPKENENSQSQRKRREGKIQR